MRSWASRSSLTAGVVPGVEAGRDVGVVPGGVVCRAAGVMLDRVPSGLVGGDAEPGISATISVAIAGPAGGACGGAAV